MHVRGLFPLGSNFNGATFARLNGVSCTADGSSIGFAAAFYADFAPAQAAAIRRAIGLMKENTL
jgi:hypothetical protein